MAMLDTSGINDIIKQMEQLGELTGTAADEMLIAGAEVVKKEMKQAASEAGLRDTGEMIDSIGYSKKPKKVNDVKSIDIYPQGVNRKGVRNAYVLFVHNYGTSRFKGTRCVEVAIARSTPKVESAMREKWNQKLKEKGLID